MLNISGSEFYNYLNRPKSNRDQEKQQIFVNSERIVRTMRHSDFGREKKIKYLIYLSSLLGKRKK